MIHTFPRKAQSAVNNLAIPIYPFMVGAMAINLFMLSLIWVLAGLPVMVPYQAFVGGALIAIPVSYAFARLVRKLIAQADRPL